jgi:predicted adenine nucleotide alpha hydrolase (AANH) superfamily ATPase
LKILLHTCCSNCAIYPVKKFRKEGHVITGFWFNPNIHPYQEYKSRLESVRTLSALWNIDVIYMDDYGLVDFLRTVVGKEKERCPFCYSMRLEKTASEAAKRGFDAFTTSLLISPYQDISALSAIGERLSDTYDVQFYFEDLRPGFEEAMKLSKELSLYRQKYCGCIYSEMERFQKPSSRQGTRS